MALWASARQALLRTILTGSAPSAEERQLKLCYKHSDTGCRQVILITNAHVPMSFLCRKNAIVAANVSNAPGTTISVTCKQARRQGVWTHRQWEHQIRQEQHSTTWSLQKSTHKNLLTTRNIFRLSPWPTSWPLSKFMPKIPATALISPTAKVPVVNTSPIYSKSLSQSACLATCN